MEAVPDLSILLQALETADVFEAISCTDGITVFAPNNMAFTALGDLGTTLLTDPGYVLHLENTLAKHVLIDAVIPTENINDKDATFPLSGEFIMAAVDADSVCFNPGNACVVLPDVMANNGIAHVVDNVILPNWATTGFGDALFNNGLDILFSLLTCAGADILAFEGTVFAPTDAAFEALLAGLGLDFDTLCNDRDTLEPILAYHLLETVVPSVLLDTVNTPTTVQGDPVTIINCGSDSLSINDGNIIEIDILFNKGVIHVIDTVLIPGTAPEPPSQKKYGKKSKSDRICH